MNHHVTKHTRAFDCGNQDVSHNKTLKPQTVAETGLKIKTAIDYTSTRRESWWRCSHSSANSLKATETQFREKVKVGATV